MIVSNCYQIQLCDFQVVLKVKVICAPPPEIKWFKGDADITKDGRFKITKDPNGFDTLIISSASRSSAGEYEIKASNEMGTASSRCNIKVNSESKNFFPNYISDV